VLDPRIQGKVLQVLLDLGHRLGMLGPRRGAGAPDKGQMLLETQGKPHTSQALALVECCGGDPSLVLEKIHRKVQEAFC